MEDADGGQDFSADIVTETDQQLEVILLEESVLIEIIQLSF